MKFLRFASFLFAALLVLLAEKDACAQWKNVAPGVLKTGAFGCLIYKDGILWAGKKDLWFSPDFGKTWQKSNLNSPTDIYDIDFFDRNNGLVSTTSHGLFLTRDQGATWSNINSNTFWKVNFNSTKDIIHGTTYGAFYTSTDGGVSWRTSTIGNFATCSTISKKGIVYIFAGYPQGGVSSSSDFGFSWLNNSVSLDGDCNTISSDSCNPNILYLLNENHNLNGDGNSKIYVSHDAGLNWTPVAAHSGIYFVGALSNSQNAIFAASFNNGIERSTDQGISWKNILGPDFSYDSRSIVCLNNNTLFALDIDGNIWKTDNSGGDSIGGITQLNYTFLVQTADQQTDTIGGSVAVPIWLKGFANTEDVDIVIHYDQSLNYIGTYSLNGAKLDIPGESWVGRSKIHIFAADSSQILAYSRFDVFADSATKLKVTFDSVTATNQSIDPCTLAVISPLTIPASAIITPPSGCGTDIISRFMHDGTMPQLSIIPNPTNGEISITSTGDLGHCSVAIYDMLGNQKGMNMLTISQNAPAKLALPAASGVYNVRVQSGEKSWDLRVVVNR